MKIKKVKINELRDLVREVIKEAAAEGHIQKIYRRSYARMIDKVSSGGNKNTPPFTNKSSKPGQSGPVTEQKNLLLEDFEKALAEGKVGDWVSKNFKKLKPALGKFKEKLASGVKPFSVAVQKWNAGEKLSEEEKKAFISALAIAGIMMLPGGSMLLILKHLVVNQMGGV